MVFYHRWWWYLVEEVYLMGWTNLSFFLTHGVKLSTCVWEGGVSADVESWLGSFAVSMFLGSGVFAGICCWSNCEAVYSIECCNMLQIPWLFLDGLPLFGMVFMLLVSLLNSLQEAILICGCMGMVVIEQFLPMQNENWAVSLDSRYLISHGIQWNCMDYENYK